MFPGLILFFGNALWFRYFQILRIPTKFKTKYCLSLCLHSLKTSQSRPGVRSPLELHLQWDVWSLSCNPQEELATPSLMPSALPTTQNTGFQLSIYMTVSTTVEFSHFLLLFSNKCLQHGYISILDLNLVACLTSRFWILTGILN